MIQSLVLTYQINKIMRFKEFLNESTSVDDWIQKIYAQFPAWPLDDNQRVIVVGGSGKDQQFVWFELSKSSSGPKTAEISWIAAHPQRSGVGTKGLTILQNLAKQDGISLMLSPWSKGKVSQSQLTKFYKRAGFSPASKGSKLLVWDSSKNESVNNSQSSLNEAISIVKHTPALEKLLVAKINDALSIPTALQDAIDDSTSYVSFTKNLVLAFKSELINLLPKAILNFLNSNLGRPGLVSNVLFVDLGPGTNGVAINDLIKMNYSYINELGDAFEKLLRRVKPSGVRVLEKNPEDIKKLISSIRSNEFKIMFNDFHVTVIMNEIADVLLHEAVHTLQNFPLLSNPHIYVKGQVQRSYLSNPKLKSASGEDEYLQKHKALNFDARWQYLYAADPREMAAFAHNIVQSIAREYNLFYNTPREFPLNLIASAIPSMVSQYIQPTNDRERKVFNRYIKLVYQELSAVYYNKD